ncbi:uncharacterized protein [Halyomorpha halys]|uniref:uncharacterized protein n=1 Tax=Halyomorpha halys TaxID=286706 RepID=UPI0006D4E2E2|nr:uncharacterized protein LOC106680698 [Halyomorpha halys]
MVPRLLLLVSISAALAESATVRSTEASWNVQNTIAEEGKPSSENLSVAILKPSSNQTDHNAFTGTESDNSTDVNRNITNTIADEDKPSTEDHSSGIMRIEPPKPRHTSNFTQKLLATYGLEDAWKKFNLPDDGLDPANVNSTRERLEKEKELLELDTLNYFNHELPKMHVPIPEIPVGSRWSIWKWLLLVKLIVAIIYWTCRLIERAQVQEEERAREREEKMAREREEKRANEIEYCKMP